MLTGNFDTYSKTKNISELEGQQYGIRGSTLPSKVKV
jgi:hypothetical protein